MNNRYNTKTNSSITLPYDQAYASSFQSPANNNGFHHYDMPKYSKGSTSIDITEEQIEQLVVRKGFTVGLAQSLSLNTKSFPYRIWIIDNSSSMAAKDGHRIVTFSHSNSDNIRFEPCTRYDELRETVNYHIIMSDLLHAPTSFRLLNAINNGTQQAQHFTVAFGDNKNLGACDRDVTSAISFMGDTKPYGCTPLTDHVLGIYHFVSQKASELNAKGQRVAIILATDGLPTDERGNGGRRFQQQFVDALRSLEGLPVWLVIRLCTDNEETVEFYNSLDDQLELSLDVLDDFCAEAAEVYENNPWLNYTLPLHRCREMGYQDRVFDLIDNRKLTRSEIRDFCAMLFGHDNMDGAPDPEIDWDGFSTEIERLVSNEKNQWNPMKKRPTPLIDMKKLNKAYGGKKRFLFFKK